MKQMKKYTLKDAQDLLNIIDHFDTIHLEDEKNLNEINKIFFIKEYNTCFDKTMTEAIKIFISFLKNYQEEYQYLINEIFNLCTQVEFFHKYNIIKILYLNEISLEKLQKIFILTDEYIADILLSYYRKEFNDETIHD